jgi:ABC-type Zn2+ transport system substrate-binding protein/surface adhesin
VLAQAVALQQADDGQRQKNDQRQVARLDEAAADGREDGHRPEARGGRRRDGRDDHHQHRVEAQDEARNDHGHADQRPQMGDVRSHVGLSLWIQRHLARERRPVADANLVPMNEQSICFESLIN